MAATRIREQTSALSGTGLMQSETEWGLRNEVLSRTLCDLISRHRPPGATRALDVGTQDGALMDRFAELTGLEWTGVDPIFLGEGRSPRGALLLPGTADKLPFTDGSFDVAMFANVYEHVLPHLRVPSLREINRVLAPGGVVVGQIPNPYFVIENHSRLPLMGWLPIRVQKQYWRLSRVPWEHDFFVVTPRHLRRDAHEAGFEVALVQRFHYPLDVIPRTVRPIARLIDRPTRRMMPWAWQFLLQLPG
jgi:SAM-dependent methyltransferase